VDAPGQTPEDFGAFVATHAGRVRTMCASLTGNDRLVDTMQRDLFTSVALHWWWLRRRPSRSRARTAASYLDRLYRQEARNWSEDAGARVADRLTRPSSQSRPGVQPAEAERPGARHAADDLADVAWQQASRTRNRRRLTVAVAVAAIGLLVLVAPRRPPGPGPVDLTPPLPTAVPAGVMVVPPFNRLPGLPPRDSPLPPVLDIDPGNARPLAQSPVPHALALAQQDLGPLIIVAPDGSTRSINDTALLGARMLATSLSPDGTRAALTTAEGLLVVDVTKGTLRQVAVAAQAQPAVPSLVWRSAKTVLVPTRSGAQEIDIDTGAATDLTGVPGNNVVTTQGSVGDGLIEMIPSGSGGTPPAILRLWRTPPVGTPAPSISPATGGPGPAASSSPSPSAGTSASAAPAADVENRTVFGPPWVGRWSGPGWSTSDLFARSCDPRTLALPQSVGIARDAISVVGRNGLAIGTLAVVDGTTLDLLGFADADTVFVSTGMPQSGTRVLAWNAGSRELRRVTTTNGYARISLPDLFG